MSVSDKHPLFASFNCIIRNLMQGGGDNPIAVDGRTSEQEIVGGLGVNDITCQLRFRSPIWHMSLIIPRGWVLLELNPQMIVCVALS